VTTPWRHRDDFSFPPTELLFVCPVCICPLFMCIRQTHGDLLSAHEPLQKGRQRPCRQSSWGLNWVMSNATFENSRWSGSTRRMESSRIHLTLLLQNDRVLLTQNDRLYYPKMIDPPDFTTPKWSSSSWADSSWYFICVLISVGLCVCVQCVYSIKSRFFTSMVSRNTLFFSSLFNFSTSFLTNFLSFWMFNPWFCLHNQTRERLGKSRKGPDMLFFRRVESWKGLGFRKWEKAVKSERVTDWARERVHVWGMWASGCVRNGACARLCIT